MSDFDIDRRLLDKLTKAFKDADLTDLEFSNGQCQIRLQKKAPKIVAQSTMMAPAMPSTAAPAISTAAPTPESSTTPDATAASAGPDLSKAVRSPMVGTAYLAPEPEKPNFIAVGDKVTKGQTLLIIEAMKVMNPLESPRDGTVLDILVKDGEPVEFDQPLVILD